MQNKKDTGKKQTSKKNDTRKDSNEKGFLTRLLESRAKKEATPFVYNENSFFNIIAPYAIAFAGIFLLVTFIFRDHMSIAGDLADILFGLFSVSLWALPPSMLIIALRWKKDAPKRLVSFRIICLAFTMIFAACFFGLVLTPYIKEEGTRTAFTVTVDTYKRYDYNIVSFLFTSGKQLHGGGIIGSGISFLLVKFCGKIGCGIISVFATLLFGFLAFGITIGDIIAFVRGKVVETTYDFKVAHDEKKALREQRAAERPKKEPKKQEARGEGVSELSIDNDDDDQDIALDGKKSKKEKKAESKEKDLLSGFFDEAIEEIKCTPDDELEPEETGLENSDFFGPDISAFESTTDSPEEPEKGSIEDIFCEDAVIEGAGASIRANQLDSLGEETAEDDEDIPFDLDPQTQEIAPPEVPVEEIYEFPPIDMLPGNPNPSVFKVTEELTETAKNLVNTLSNFNVRTKVMNISCGPTVTRFELKPEVGVKVRSIQNLADDIALHLRASAVRIEAPIPGKDAVGIEIPNKTVSTVYIKELIDRPEFSDLPSKLSVALGMDVSGSPVYMDIAKMPHLLIAGATGMGKSVCINSFIVSILYKARPDEVKLILIDPKKVEFAMYDSIPHLLVPVVTDPKKAAGSLAWAVNEMEHRFNLIEAAKCRDIKSYNAVCEKDDRFKKMCQIVIIIDELADLMMTARDEVETSICRLAQKARAAGMHLIIGTQRPSVDVITGVIKANVPSRIAFTVASQVDSRTILDVVGAENLVGKGDMLFAPVGCMKPTRVQGSFVGPDSVIEEITDFLRTSGITSYDDDIQNAIELEAQRCSEKKKGKGAAAEGAETYVGSTDGFERDEMMLPALELGVDMGQISTSLVQRKLSLGYARAARIVDMLSEMGFVGPFEGSKPRKVLITREEFHEIKMRENSEE